MRISLPVRRFATKKGERMITFILIFAGLVLLFAVWMIAKGATQQKRSGQSPDAVVHSAEQGSGSPSVHRATGSNN